MIARSAPSPSSPAPSTRRYAALGPDCSARPSKRGDRAANAYLTTLASTEDTRSSDSVRQVGVLVSSGGWLSPERQTLPLAARIELSVSTHLAQLALFGHSFVRTFGRFDPVLKFTIRLRKQAHNFIEFRGGKSSGPAVQQLHLLTNPISMPRHADAPAETVPKAVLHVLD
jgi:hypothetical protein